MSISDTIKIIEVVTDFRTNKIRELKLVSKLLTVKELRKALNKR